MSLVARLIRRNFSRERLLRMLSARRVETDLRTADVLIRRYAINSARIWPDTTWLFSAADVLIIID